MRRFMITAPLLLMLLGQTASAQGGYAGYLEAQNEAIRVCRQQLDVENDLSGANLNTQALRLACELEAWRRERPAEDSPFHTAGQTEQQVRDVALAAAAVELVEMATFARGDVDRVNTALWGQARLRMAFMLHRYDTLMNWSPEVRTAILDMLRKAHHAWDPIYKAGELTNWELPNAGAWVLAGEALGDAEMLQEGIDLLDRMAGRVARQGSPEINSPHYAKYLWGNLLLMKNVQNPEVVDLVDALFAYVALTAAHLYLPGGGLGAPQARGVRGTSTFVVDPDPITSSDTVTFIDLLVGDSELLSTTPPIGALTDFALPDIIRSIFLDKHDGYEFRGRALLYAPSPPPGQRTYDVGWLGAPTVPWHAVTVPDGGAQMGIIYGAGSTTYIDDEGILQGKQSVSMGAYLRAPAPEAGFTVLAHAHAHRNDWGDHDLDPTDNVAPPKMFEYATYRRFLHERTLIQLWDPSTEAVDSTQMHIPRWDLTIQAEEYRQVPSALGGIDPNEWRIARSGANYVAVLPLGEIAYEEQRTPATGALPYSHLVLDGRSGSIVELATTDQFDTIDDYAADLSDRPVAFETTAFLGASVDTASGTPMFLHYDTDTRKLDHNHIQSDDELGSGLLESPFVTWDDETFELTVQHPAHPGESLEYDFGDPGIPTAPHSLRVSGRSQASQDVNLYWQASEDDGAITRYEAWSRSEAGDESLFDTITDMTPTSGVNYRATYSVPTGLTENTTLSFFVRAFDDQSNESRRSNVVRDVRIGETPAGPQNLTGLSFGPGVILDWDDSADPQAVGYRVFRTRVDDPNDTFQADTTDSTFIDSEDLLPNEAYTYVVRSLDAWGLQSHASNEIENTTTPEFDPPDPVVAFFGSAVGSAIELQWLVLESNSEETLGFMAIYRDGQFRAFSAPLASAWQDTAVEPATEYTYVVHVWDVHGNASPASHEVTVMTNP